MKSVISPAAWKHAEYAENLISRMLAPVKIVPDDEGLFLNSTLSCATAGQVVISQVTGASFRVLRSRALIASEDREFVKVAMPARGRLGVEQDGRQCLLGPGSLAIYDTRRPYTMRFAEPSDIVMLGIPPRLLGPRANRLAPRAVAPIPISTASQRFAAALLRTAATELDTLAGDSSPDLTEALISLVLSAVSGQRAGQEFADRVLAYCQAHLSDPWLSPERVARAHGVSVRHLNRLLQPAGITLSAWVRARRLERITRDLADPALADRTVERIAADWGILDASHLSRALRAQYGQSAAQIRRQSAQARTG